MTGNAHDKRTLKERLEWIANWSEPDIDLADAGTCREALDRITALQAEVERLREATIRCGRAVGCLLDDRVSTEFLTLVPQEVEAFAARAAIERTKQ